MGADEYVINAASAVVAMEYMDYAFRKKYCGARRRVLFVLGCAVYFFTVTALNMASEFEGVLGFFMELY